MSVLTLSIPMDAEAPGEARSALREFLQDECPSAFVEDACLLTSELVTNSTRHAGAPLGSVVDLWSGLSPETLRVEVADSGRGFALAAQADRTSGGWGLIIVDRVADRWGILRDPARTWFELDRLKR